MVGFITRVPVGIGGQYASSSMPDAALMYKAGNARCLPLFFRCFLENAVRGPYFYINGIAFAH
jgi:hypothetical protein